MSTVTWYPEGRTVDTGQVDTGVAIITWTAENAQPAPEPGDGPSLDFSDPDNSQYLPLL